MRKFGMMALTLGALACVTADAQAQGQRRGFGGGRFMAGYALLSNKSVQQELKLDDTQAEKIGGVVRDINAKMREKIADIPQEERREKFAELIRSTNEEIKTATKDELKPEQVRRLEQIIRQQSGIAAFAEPGTAEKLELSADQKEKLREIATETASKQRELFESGNREEMREKSATIRKEAQEKAVAVLNDKQQGTWKELLGAPFEVVREDRPNN